MNTLKMHFTTPLADPIVCLAAQAAPFISGSPSERVIRVRHLIAALHAARSGWHLYSHPNAIIQHGALVVGAMIPENHPYFARYASCVGHFLLAYNALYAAFPQVAYAMAYQDSELDDFLHQTLRKFPPVAAIDIDKPHLGPH